MASITRPLSVKALTVLVGGLGLACFQGSALANAPAGEGWIAIPTRIDEIKVRYKSMGCKDGICTIGVQGLTPGEAISNEQINCKANTIRNATGPGSTGWKVIAPGTVDLEISKAVCR